VAATKKTSKKPNRSAKPISTPASTSTAPREELHPMDRRSSGDRRAIDRRQHSVPVAAERRTGQRRKVPRRRQIDPTTCERDYSDDEIEFMNALDDYKRSSGRMFPTCSEILEVVRKLGYQKSKSPEAVATLVAVEVSDSIPVGTIA